MINKMYNCGVHQCPGARGMTVPDVGERIHLNQKINNNKNIYYSKTKTNKPATAGVRNTLAKYEAYVRDCVREMGRERERERERERLVTILKYVTKGTRSMGPGNQKLKSKF